MRIDLHAKVLTREREPAGNLEQAVIDPRTNEVTDFVVSTGGLFGKDVLVPHAEVDQASTEGDVLRLRLGKRELERLPAYEPAQYGAPPQGWIAPLDYAFPAAGYLWPITPLGGPIQAPTQEVVPPAAREPWEAPRSVRIDKGTSVVDRVGSDVGAIEDVRLEAGSDRLEGIDVRLGGALRRLFTGGDVIYLGADLVDSFEPRLVRLRIEKEALVTR
jgi:uncharacterized protein YrrD